MGDGVEYGEMVCSFKLRGGRCKSRDWLQIDFPRSVASNAVFRIQRNEVLPQYHARLEFSDLTQAVWRMPVWSVLDLPRTVFQLQI